MSVSSLSALAQSQAQFAPQCASIPSMFLAYSDLPGAAALLSDVAAAAAKTTGGVPRSPKDLQPDPLAGLWFIRAVHLFAKAGGDPSLVADKLRPLAKRVLQELISSAGVGDVRMDDGGLLVGPAGSPTLRLNALWYSALETCAADLKTVRDPAGDHFERLAGRFRRSFVKAYWCDAHGCICPPEMRAPADPAAPGPENHGALPNANQLLLTFLPASPIPRTKQRQLIGVVRNNALGPVGVKVHHPDHGLVESPLHRAWLALGILASADQPAPAQAEASAIAAPLLPLRAVAHNGGIPAFYRDGQPLPGEAPDLLATAEVLGTLQTLKLQ
ncbi:MAG: amylo-alpha-1,6-glucosidase [Phycisphaerae bacterium]